MNIPSGLKCLFNVLLFILVGVGGFLLGKYQTEEYASKLMMNQLYGSASTSLYLRVRLLKTLHSGQIDQGEDMLEKLIDADLSTLALYKKIPPNQRNSEIIDSIRSAKEYRKAFPQHLVHPNIANSVKTALDLAE